MNTRHLSCPMAQALGLTFVWAPPGDFRMGSPDTEPVGWRNEGRRQVTLSRGFWIQTTPLTQAQWVAVMDGNPSFFPGNDRPVEQVSWEDAQGFIRELNGRRPGCRYRLPTEAEWEYACRAGTSGARYGDLDAIAWHNGNSGGMTQPVGRKAPNDWGLFDMIGNIWEWCADWYGPCPDGPLIDPLGPSAGVERVVRGGAWNHGAPFCRADTRYEYEPDIFHGALGFRLACNP